MRVLAAFNEQTLRAERMTLLGWMSGSVLWRPTATDVGPEYGGLAVYGRNVGKTVINKLPQIQDRIYKPHLFTQLWASEF